MIPAGALPGRALATLSAAFPKNALERAPARLEAELHERLRAVWDDTEDIEEARPGLRALAAEIANEQKLPELAEWIEVEGEETLPCSTSPRPAGAGEADATYTSNGTTLDVIVNCTMESSSAAVSV